MPEGPEVRLNGDSLRTILSGRRVTEIRLLSGKLARNGVARLSEFKPSPVKSVYVKGKTIVVAFEHGGELTSTLGMAGWWYPSEREALRYYDEAARAYKGGKLVSALETVQASLKYGRVALLCDDVELAVYCDMRNFGNLEYHPSGAQEHLAKRIGIDLLNELPSWPSEVCYRELLACKRDASKRQLNMKLGDLALEQSLIAGLGNIYRAETLWLTGLNPHDKFGSLSDNDWLRFCETGSCVLQIAYSTHGMMYYSRELLEACGHKGLEVQGHLVYGKLADPIGRPIVRDDSFNRPLWRLA